MSNSVTGAKALENAKTEYALGHYQRVIDILSSTKFDENEYMDFAYLIGLAYSRQKNFDEALLYLEQLVTQDNNLTRVLQCRFVLAWIYSITGRSKLSEYELKKIVDSSGETAQVCSALGHAHWMQGRLDEALDWYEKALVKEPDNPSALNGCGYLLAQSGKKLQTALAYCKKAIEQQPKNPAYADSLGWVLFKLGRITEAGKYFKVATLMLPDSDEAKEHFELYKKAVREK